MRRLTIKARKQHLRQHHSGTKSQTHSYQRTELRQPIWFASEMPSEPRAMIIDRPMVTAFSRSIKKRQTLNSEAKAQ